MVNEPGWSADGGHPNNTLVQDLIQPLAKQYGVSIIFGGHLHYYARAEVDGIEHITVGSGGAELYDPHPRMENIVTTAKVYSFVEIAIAGDTLTETAISIDGTVVDTFTLKK